MDRDFHRIRRLPPYLFAEVNEMKARARAAGEDIIDFGMGNPDRPTPPHIVEKMIETARDPRAHRYSTSRGIPGLRRAIAAYYDRRFGVEIDPDREAVVTLGSKEGLANLAQAISSPGDIVLVPNPSYPIHPYGFIIAGASAYSRLIDFATFRKIADEVEAFLVADIAHIAGLVVAGLHPDPLPYAHVVTSTTHKTLRGPRGGIILGNDEELGKKIDRMIFPGIQGGPLEHVIAAKAAAFFEALRPEFKEYARTTIDNAQALAGALAKRGYRIVSGGTDNHMFLVDLRPNEMTGKTASAHLDAVHITISKSMIPFDSEKPWITSGIRIGTPAITTRGFTTEEMEAVADLIDRGLRGEDSEAVRTEVIALARSHPMP